MEEVMPVGLAVRICPISPVKYSDYAGPESNRDCRYHTLLRRDRSALSFSNAAYFFSR
jgi:hypothetical protein